MYEFTWLNEKLLFIKWHESASSDITRKFIAELYSLLNQRKTPFYVVVDLRHGHILDPQSFSRIRFLTQHKNWSGSAAFYNDPISNISNTTFQMPNSIQPNKDVVSDIPEKAIGFLEFMEPGLTKDIDWSDVLCD